MEADMTVHCDQINEMVEKVLRDIRPGALALQAAELTKPKTRSGFSKKLRREEAIAAMRVVSSMVRRFGLEPTKVLVGGSASKPADTYRLYLTSDEMSGAVAIGPQRRLHKALAAHVDSVRRICRHAAQAGHAVDEMTLLDELAKAVPDFLEKFREREAVDPDEELANDINRVAAWLASPHRDVEIPRFFEEAERERVAFDPNRGGMTFEGPFGENAGSNIPLVPLLIRVVATGTAELFDRDAEAAPPADDSLFAEPALKPIGTTRCVMAYKIGLGVFPGAYPRRLEIAFTLDPVTYVGEAPDHHDDWLMTWARLTERAGHPWRGSRELLPDSERWFRIQEVRYACDEFEAYEKEVYATDEGAFDDERLIMRRRLEITGAECRRLLDEDQRRASEGVFVFSDLKEASVLPRTARRESGEDSEVLRHRLEAALYASAEPSIAGLLLEEARRRIEAMEEYKLRHASGEQQRKVDFRRRMRA
jgi:hypothetical protein